jgi:hypothetical protein
MLAISAVIHKLCEAVTAAPCAAYAQYFWYPHPPIHAAAAAAAPWPAQLPKLATQNVGFRLPAPAPAGHSRHNIALVCKVTVVPLLCCRVALFTTMVQLFNFTVCL